jgi:LmbE family N-acetylglucosaminyl deacetylase
MLDAPWPEATIRVTPPSLFTDGWAWRLDQDRALPPLEALGTSNAGSALVVVAHPDDETLAMGATLASLAAADVSVDVVCLSAGEAALDHLAVVEPDLGERRAAELAAACTELGVRCRETPRWPDGRLDKHVDEAAKEIGGLVDELDPDVVVTLWRHDPHPDHQATAAVARQAAGHRPVVEMLLWAVHWTDPMTVDVDVRRVETSSAARQAKARALASYPSQTRPLRQGLYPILPLSVINWPHECVVVA